MDKDFPELLNKHFTRFETKSKSDSSTSNSALSTDESGKDELCRDESCRDESRDDSAEDKTAESVEIKITTSEVLKELQGINVNKSAGPKLCYSKILKNVRS